MHFDVLRKIEEVDDKPNRSFEFLATAFFREFLDAERKSSVDSPVTRVREIERLHLPLLKVGL
jgi:hypothetical protein